MKKVLLFSVIILLTAGFLLIPSKATEAKHDTDTFSLPVVGSAENLKKLLSSYISSEQLYRDMGEITTVNKMAQAAAPEQAASGSSDYSTTNIQVQGVDEADIVKTDGKYIYQVAEQHIMIINAVPPNKMKVIKQLSFNEERFSPQELFVDEKYLIVIGSSYENIPLDYLSPLSKNIKIYPPYRTQQKVKAVVFDISNKNDIKQIRKVELSGNYVSSRKIGSNLYLVANQRIDYYHIMEQDECPNQPFYRDSAAEKDCRFVDFKKIYYFPECIVPNYLVLAGLNLEKPDEPVNVSAYLGSGENIYATEKNLYAAVTNSRTVQPRPLKNDITGSILPLESPRLETTIYRFTLDQGKIKFMKKGNVPGTILNQFSMDEHNGFLRLATTSGEVWRSDEFTSKNNIYILNGDLRIVGRVEDIAPGERIYSTRFMGDRAYMVTFKKVDPLFVIDLKNPDKPKILGALKIPGYSDYLHPYDENHIMGFGKDTVEISQSWSGSTKETMAFYQGMKIAIFDVTDVEHPVQMYQEIIGDRGTDSQLLRNHKALLFSREKNLLAFPVTVMETNKNSISYNGIPQYGEFSFQGAYVYQIDLVNGFKLRGKISHLNHEDMLKSGSGWYQNKKNIERVLYIDETLYTISPAMIQAHDLASLKEINRLELP
ncbi:MAG: beta-propeller domain-containing protein [Desulfitobacteriaceae bacterium]|nr:beta-propeller domain-containing protein [Desulfitobacteriaceae bacterium]